MSLEEIEEYSQNLNTLYFKNEIKNILYRTSELNQFENFLGSKLNRSILIIGNSGVGKTALVHGFVANQYEKSEIAIKKHTIFELNLVQLFDKFEQRLIFSGKIQKLIDNLITNPYHSLFIENLSDLFSAYLSGAIHREETTITLFDFLAKHIRNGDISLITCCDAKYLEVIEKKHPQIANIFHKIYLNELTEEETYNIIKFRKEEFEKFHLVNYNEEIIRKCIELSSFYLETLSNPKKAIMTFDSVGAIVKVRAENSLPKHILEFNKQIREIKDLKNTAVKNQQYERAADLRDDESRLIRQLEFAKIEWSEQRSGKPDDVIFNDIYEAIAEIVHGSKDQILNKERVRNNPYSKHENKTFKERLKDFELDDKSSIAIDNIPNVLRTSLQQYILFFREFLKQVKGIEIFFNVAIIEKGLRIDINPDEIDDFSKLQDWFDEYMGYVFNKSKDFSVNFEHKITEIEGQLAMAELKNQIRYLESQLEVKQLAIDGLKLLNPNSKFPRLSEPEYLKFLHSEGYSNKKEFVKALKIKLSKDKISEVFDKIFEFSENAGTTDIDELIIIKSNFSAFRSKQNRGLLTSQDSNERAKVVNSLLNFINDSLL